MASHRTGQRRPCRLATSRVRSTRVPGAPTRGNTGRAFRIAIFAAASIRLVIASSTFGTNDALIWTQLADLINEDGLPDVYALTPFMNHPPLPALYMAGARAWATSVEIPFAFALKLPALVGDGLSATAIYLSRRSATNVQRARRSVMWFLFNPAVIALSAFHGNTDSFYAGLIALAVTLLWRRPALAGLLVAAALNIKLLPLCSFRRSSWRCRRAVAADSLAALQSALCLSWLSQQSPHGQSNESLDILPSAKHGASRASPRFTRTCELL